MEKQAFERLLLKTAFSCMACDGHIDDREVELIHSLGIKDSTFGDLAVQEELAQFVQEINAQGHDFLKGYFTELRNAHLGREEELKVIHTAIQTIQADDKVEYSEIRFFKIIRSKLTISNQEILTVLPEIESYLEQDIITDSYINRLKTDFFANQELPELQLSWNPDNLNLDS